MPPGADSAPTVVSVAAPGSEVRRRVLRAALTVTQQRGYHGTTATRVAETAGVEPAVITSHFPSRVDMLRSGLALAFEDWAQEVPTRKPVEPLPDLRAEISRRLREGVAASRRAADFWRLGLLMRLEPALAESDCCDLFIDVRERTRRALRDYWARILPDDRGADPEQVELAVNAHMSLIDGAIIAGHSNPDWDLEAMMDFIATGVAGALGTPSGEEDSGR